MTTAAVSILGVHDVGMTFEGAGGRRAALEDISFDIGARDLVAIVGRAAAARPPCSGSWPASSDPPRARSGWPVCPSFAPSAVCLVFQHYAATLLPWRNALDNVLFGLRARGEEGGQLRQSALALLDRMGLAADAQRFPWELSGGMQQRVALARALIRRPRVLLLDEPFNAVDERTRASLQELLLTIHREETCSIVLVTHDLDEVLHLSQRIVVLAGRPARLRQVIDGAAGLSREALRSHLSVVRGRP